MVQWLLIIVCVAAHCARLCAGAQEDDQRAAFFRVVDTWQKGPYGDGRLLSTQQVALLAGVMYKTFTERGLTDVVVKALGEYRYPQGQEPWRPTNDTIRFTEQNVQAIIDSLMEVIAASATVYDAYFIGEYSYLLYYRFGKDFYTTAIPYWLALCTNETLVKNSEATRLLGTIGYGIQQHGIVTGDVMMIKMFLDTSRIVVLQSNADRMGRLNLWPEPVGTYGRIVPAAEIIRRIERETNHAVVTCLYFYLALQDTQVAYDYYAKHARPYCRSDRDAHWKEHLRQYRQRVTMAEERRKREALEHKGMDAKAAKQKEYNRLLQRLEELRSGRHTARTAGEYWRVLKQVDARQAEWAAADICFEQDEFVALATNYVSPAVRRAVYAEALDTTNYTPAQRYIPLAAATVLGIVLEPDDIAGLVKHVNKAKPMRVLAYEDDELTDAESGGRIDVFVTVVQSAVEHERRAALEALAAQVPTLRDPWVRETVSKMLEHAKISVATHAPPAKTDYFNVE